ncbi:MAG: hypothetical protein A2V21_301970 [Deltaproteobacteria bacterium GWC2_55_46]|nr:MAG: hypothetical protein A2Z79_06695 [Deltaproteobacteria bacterium GWA2_55_82]OGQ63334.1 MAG: hypothetical protein A3I81_00905 [Deltaproteobacteria bacterium RIFCSPLOWO2_02_FULL_55_12]OIJ75009.1 MAG: hypothetical protein A2V21_301970 [Deltaproteobacteria bacterium GWC2_55_46]
MKRPVVLVVDDDDFISDTLEIILGDSYCVLKAKNGPEALGIINSRAVDIALLDLKLPGMNGLETLERIKEFDGSIEVVMLSAFDSAQQAVTALKKGAYDYITKPFDNDELLSTLGRLSEGLKLKSELEFLKEELNESYKERYSYGEIISKSPRMMKIFDLMKAVSRTPSNVLITGESGTGKELVARGIHYMSDRKEKPFVAVNCGAVPAELMESELFGHEKGAFTGAHQRKIGKFEYADMGTIFLDEVSTLPTYLQIKLLRVLQERSFERLGSNTPIKVDIRIIAATNVGLEGEVLKGRFREDLYYRLKVVPVDLPALRGRKEDIPLLVQHFLEKHSRKCCKRIEGVEAAVVSAFMGYSWPGNIRELENLMERLVVLAPEGGVIRADDLPLGLFTGLEAGNGDSPDFRDAVRSFERRYITGVLDRSNWNRLEASRALNIHRNTLLLKMKELGIKSPGH